MRQPPKALVVACGIVIVAAWVLWGLVALGVLILTCGLISLPIGGRGRPW